MSCSDIFLGIVAIIFPPIAVWIKSGLCTADSLINILLCMLGYLPGLLHAWYIIAKYPEHDYDRVDGDVERQDRVTYYYISHEQPSQGNRRQYGTQGHAAPAVPGNKPQNPQQSGVVRTADDGHFQGASGGSSRPAPATSSVGAGTQEDGAPPSYSEVVRGDNKIQTQD